MNNAKQTKLLSQEQIQSLSFPEPPVDFADRVLFALSAPPKETPLPKLKSRWLGIGAASLAAASFSLGIATSSLLQGEELRQEVPNILKAIPTTLASTTQPGGPTMNPTNALLGTLGAVFAALPQGTPQGEFNPTKTKEFCEQAVAACQGSWQDICSTIFEFCKDEITPRKTAKEAPKPSYDEAFEKAQDALDEAQDEFDEAREAMQEAMEEHNECFFDPDCSKAELSNHRKELDKARAVLEKKASALQKAAEAFDALSSSMQPPTRAPYAPIAPVAPIAPIAPVAPIFDCAPEDPDDCRDAEEDYQDAQEEYEEAQEDAREAAEEAREAEEEAKAQMKAAKERQKEVKKKIKKKLLKRGQEIEPTLSAAEIQEIMNEGDFSQCQAIDTGKVMVKITINSDGEVISVSGDGTLLSTCVSGMIWSLEFPGISSTSQSFPYPIYIKK